MPLGAGYLNSGGIYDPATDTWAALATGGAPTGRSGHVAIWTGAKMLVWGGQDSSGYPNGKFYVP